MTELQKIKKLIRKAEKSNKLSEDPRKPLGVRLAHLKDANDLLDKLEKLIATRLAKNDKQVNNLR
jgi:cytosine/adenosine deaminase-related metal-dependent hydrolase